MRAGKYRHRVQIQKQTSARDEFNQQLDTWETLDTVAAEIFGRDAREFRARSGEAAEATHLVKMRAYRGLTTTHRLLFGARIFDITAVDDIEERGIEMHLICKERVG